MSRFAWKDGDRVRVVELAPNPSGGWQATVDGAAWPVKVEPLGEGELRLVSGERTLRVAITAVGDRRFVHLEGMDFVLERTEARAGRRAAAGGGLESPMPGVVTRVHVQPGDTVSRGQPLVALEAMKMEHVIRAPRDGTVTRVRARAGEMVDGGVALVELEEDATG